MQFLCRFIISQLVLHQFSLILYVSNVNCQNILAKHKDIYRKLEKLKQGNDLEQNIYGNLPANPTTISPELIIPTETVIDEDDIIWSEPADDIILLTHPSLYDKYQPPGQIFGETTNIELGFYIESLSSFRVLTMDFEVDLYLLCSWKDRRLSHRHKHPILINDLNIVKRFWNPDLYFVNSKLSYTHHITSENFLIFIYNDGEVLSSTRVSATLSCTLDLKYFPMDEQECFILLQSYAFVRNVLNLTWHVGNGYPVMINENVLISDMDIVKTSTTEFKHEYELNRGKGLWHCAKASITMKRKFQFHVFQAYIPTAMLVTISWFSFWLDVKAAPARVGLTITTLLTLLTISNGNRQDLPLVPYMKASDLWIVVCKLFVFCVLLQYILINFVLSRPFSNNCSVHKRMKWTNHEQDPLLTNKEKKACINCEKHLLVQAKKVDTISRLLFPFAFITFAAIYFAYYMYIVKI